MTNIPIPRQIDVPVSIEYSGGGRTISAGSGHIFLDATATPDQILYPKTAYILTGKVEGTIPIDAAQTNPVSFEINGDSVNAYITSINNYRTTAISGTQTFQIPNVPQSDCTFAVSGDKITASYTTVAGFSASGITQSSSNMIDAVEQPAPTVTQSGNVFTATYTTVAGYTAGGITKTATIPIETAEQPAPTITWEGYVLGAAYTTIEGVTGEAQKTETFQLENEIYDGGTIMPTAAGYSYAADSLFLNAATVPAEPNLLAANINPNVSIFGVQGTAFSGVTATAADIKSGKVILGSDLSPITGTAATIPGQTFNGAAISQTFNGGGILTSQLKVNPEPNLIAENVKKNVNIFGVTGTMDIVTDYSEDGLYAYIPYRLDKPFAPVMPSGAVFTTNVSVVYDSYFKMLNGYTAYDSSGYGALGKILLSSEITPSAYTVSLWFRSVNFSSSRPICSLQDSTLNWYWGIELYAVSNGIQIYCPGKSTSSVYPITLSTSVWYFLCVTFAVGETPHVYVNGTEVSYPSGEEYLMKAAPFIMIHAGKDVYDAGGGYYVARTPSADFCELKLYNRVLTAAEVLAKYQMGK